MASEPTAESINAALDTIRGYSLTPAAREGMSTRIALALDAAREEEREKCAKVVEDSVRRAELPEQPHNDSWGDTCLRIVYCAIDQAAAKIRSLNAPKLTEQPKHSSKETV
jgi:hypothetical protein